IPPAAPVPPEMPKGMQDGMMVLKPHFVREKTKEKIYIEKDEFKIGKSKIHADYAIENNAAISRVHVIVIRRNGVNYLKDNDSTNGTWIDGERLEPGREILLKANMKVKFGDEDFTFFLREGEE
nr:FHA domain-containing protein [Eubacterium sp.]